MILFIRGHIRNGFDDKKLYDFIKQLEEHGMLFDIYIHTWNIKQNNISWRELVPNNTQITKPFIREYFKHLQSTIRHIIIDDDHKIKLLGKLDGNINNGPMPLIGWKNYWYGKYKMMKYLHDHNIKNENIVSIRFDLFQYSPHVRTDQLLDFILINDQNKLSKNIFFFRNEQDYCIDNIYIGNVHTMYLLCEYFHKHLDEILIKNPTIKNQEFLVSMINNTLFTKKNKKIRKTEKIKRGIKKYKEEMPK